MCCPSQYFIQLNEFFRTKYSIQYFFNCFYYVFIWVNFIFLGCSILAHIQVATSKHRGPWRKRNPSIQKVIHVLAPRSIIIIIVGEDKLVCIRIKSPHYELKFVEFAVYVFMSFLWWRFARWFAEEFLFSRLQIPHGH